LATAASVVVAVEGEDAKEEEEVAVAMAWGVVGVRVVVHLVVTEEGVATKAFTGADKTAAARCFFFRESCGGLGRLRKKAAK
jgi:hypothetical protein